MEQSSIEQDFKELCRQYGLPEGDSNYIYLLDTFRRRRQGISYTMEEICADFRALEIARMLKQLKIAEKRGFSLLVGGIKQDYSPDLVEVLRKGLVDELAGRVRKVENLKKGDVALGACLILSKGFGAGGDEGRAFIIKLPAGTKLQEQDFSPEELDEIIYFEENQAVLVEKMKGRKGTGECAGPDKSRNPELGEVALNLLNYVPEEWGTIKKYSFVFDYLNLGGWLGFKGKDWLLDAQFRTGKEKYDLIKSWVGTAKNIQE